MPVLVMAHFTTNPSVAVRDDTPAGWRDIDEAEVQPFLSFIDGQISARPDLLEPVDEAQLDRLSKILANVKV